MTLCLILNWLHVCMRKCVHACKVNVLGPQNSSPSRSCEDRWNYTPSCFLLTTDKLIQTWPTHTQRCRKEGDILTCTRSADQPRSLTHSPSRSLESASVLLSLSFLPVLIHTCSYSTPIHPRGGRAHATEDKCRAEGNGKTGDECRTHRGKKRIEEGERERVRKRASKREKEWGGAL